MSVDKFGRSSLHQLRENKYLRGPPGIGFKRTADGDFDIENKRLINVRVGDDSNDALNRKYFDHVVDLIYQKIQSIETSLESTIKLLHYNEKMHNIKNKI